MCLNCCVPWEFANVPEHHDSVEAWVSTNCPPPPPLHPPPKAASYLPPFLLYNPTPPLSFSRPHLSPSLTHARCFLRKSLSRDAVASKRKASDIAHQDLISCLSPNLSESDTGGKCLGRFGAMANYQAKSSSTCSCDFETWLFSSSSLVILTLTRPGSPVRLGGRELTPSSVPKA